MKGIVVSELEGTTGKKAWVRVNVARAAKGGRMRYVDGMIRLSKEKGLKPRKVAVDKPVTVFVRKVRACGRERGAVARVGLRIAISTASLPPCRDVVLCIAS